MLGKSEYYIENKKLKACPYLYGHYSFDCKHVSTKKSESERKLNLALCVAILFSTSTHDRRIMSLAFGAGWLKFLFWREKMGGPRQE